VKKQCIDLPDKEKAAIRYAYREMIDCWHHGTLPEYLTAQDKFWTLLLELGVTNHNWSLCKRDVLPKGVLAA